MEIIKEALPFVVLISGSIGIVSLIFKNYSNLLKERIELLEQELNFTKVRYEEKLEDEKNKTTEIQNKINKLEEELEKYRSKLKPYELIY